MAAPEIVLQLEVGGRLRQDRGRGADDEREWNAVLSRLDVRQRRQDLRQRRRQVEILQDHHIGDVPVVHSAR